MLKDDQRNLLKLLSGLKTRKEITEKGKIDYFRKEEMKRK